MRKFTSALIALHFVGLTLVGQTLNTKKLDSLFTVLSNKNLAMASIAISKDGKVIYQRAIGSARIDGTTKTPADEHIEYRIGSISKMFAATIVFQLIEEKKLSLDDKLSNYFPQLTNASRITISNMLDHRSGLPDFTKETDYDKWKGELKTQEELLALISSRKPDFEPNAKADYNNSNYLFLGFIIEKICKKSFSIVLQERVLSRIKLTRTYYASNPSLSRYESDSYKYFDNKWMADKPIPLENFGACGAIVSTPTDLLRFIHALFTGELISQASLQTMETLVDWYGMGMFAFEFNGHHGFGHNGKTEGYASSLTYYPEDKLAVAYCTNGEVYPKSEILDGVLAICFNKPFTIPAFTPVVISDSLLNLYAGKYNAPSMGIDATVTRSGNELMLEARGQHLKLIAIDTNKFWNEQFGFFFNFNNSGRQLQIIDVEQVYELAKN